MRMRKSNTGDEMSAGGRQSVQRTENIICVSHLQNQRGKSSEEKKDSVSVQSIIWMLKYRVLDALSILF